MPSESLANKTIKNSAYSFLAYAVPILFSIFVTPLIVHKIGVTDYGAYVLVNTIVGFLSLLDLGLGQALIKYISEYEAQDNRPALQNVIASANSLYLIIGTAGLMVFIALALWLLPAFGISGVYVAQARIFFLLGGTAFFLNSVNTVYTILPSALQRYDITTKISLAQLFLYNGAIIVLLLLGYQLKAIMTVNAVLIALALLVYYYQAKKLLPYISFKFGWVKEEVKKSYRFGLMAAISNLASTSLVNLDRLVIPMFLGPVALTYYSLPGNVATKTSSATSSLTSVLFPMTSAFSAVGNLDMLRRIYIRIFRNITIIAAALTCSIALFAYPILKFWIGEEFAQKGSGILVVLALTYFMVSILVPINYFILGISEMKFLVKASISMAVLNLLLLILLIPKFGILGAAWAYFISVTPIIYISYWVETKYLKLTDQWKRYGALYSKLVITTLIFVPLVKYIIFPQVNSLFSLLLLGPASVVLYGLLYYVFGFADREDIESLKIFFISVIGRFKSAKQV